MKYTIFIFLAILFLSCSQEQNVDEYSFQVEEEMEMEPPRLQKPPIPPIINEVPAGTKIIKTGNIQYEVSDLVKAKTRVDSILSQAKGYYENEQYSNYGSRSSYSLNMRIPSQEFDNVIYNLQNGIGILTSKSIDYSDVTEEYIDVNIRLENNLAYLNQYKEILKKATSVKEILEVQEKIRRIEEEIESKKGRLKYLDSQVSYSTLNLQISELLTDEIAPYPHFGIRIMNAFLDGTRSFMAFLVSIVSLWPFLVLIIALLLLRKPIFKLFRRKQNG